MEQKFSLRSRLKSFEYAFSGMAQFFATQHNAILHVIATAVAIGLCVGLHVSSTEVLFIVAAIGLVWMAELFNTAIEKLCDIVSPQWHPQIKFIKDVSAAAVLVTALAALAIGLVIFIPKLF